MSPVFILAVITPATGKEDRVRELLVQLVKDVEANEAGALKFAVSEQVDGEGTNVFVVDSTYADVAALEAHREAPHYRNLIKLAQEESLLAAPLDSKTIKPIAGFDKK